MENFRTLLSRCAALFRRSTLDAELDEELRAHLDLAIAENLQHGMSAAEARTAALRAFGGVTQTREAYRIQRGLPFLQHFARDLRFAFRQLRRAPGFTLTAVVTLALSIGANTAIFSIVNALMLKSLPYADPERIGTIFMRVQGPDPFDGQNDIDGEQWELLRDNVPSLEGAVSSEISSGVNLQAGRNVQYVHAGRVSAHYFDVLGIHPAIGRSFTDNEDRPHGPNAVVLSYGLWRSIFHADPHLIGQAIQLKGEPYTVVGVLPAGAKTPLNADVYTALQPSRQGEGGGANFGIIVRLRPGANWQQADAELNRVWANRALRFAKEFHAGSRVSFYTIPLQKGQTADLRPKALTLMLAAGFILLIACANLAGLTVVRMARRTSEIATRLALGASRWHVQRQLWIENLVLAFMGGAVGVGVAFLALRGLLSLLPLDYLPVAGVPLDGRVLAFALAASHPHQRAVRNAACARHQNHRSALFYREPHHRRRRAPASAPNPDRRRSRSHRRAACRQRPSHPHPDPLADPATRLQSAKRDDRQSFAGRRPLPRSQPPSTSCSFKSTAAMNRIPGVQSAAVGLSLPFERALNDGMTLGSGPMMGQQVMSGEIYVTPSYFETLQIPLLAGRTFTSSDQTRHATCRHRQPCLRSQILRRRESRRPKPR